MPTQVINLESKSFKSKPYRFMIQNGSLVVLETEWSSFINPWTKSVEFVVGQHRVRRGPADPDIFHPPGNRKNDLLASISEEVLKEAKVIEKEIVSLLVEVIGPISSVLPFIIAKNTTLFMSYRA
jgi:period circadian protein